MWKWSIGVAAGLWVILAGGPLPPAAGAGATTGPGAPVGQWQPIDRLSDLARWKVEPSDGVKGTIALEKDSDGQPAVRLDVDFVSGAGFVVLALDWPTALPKNYQFSMEVRGQLPDNNLEFKLVDEAGTSVWWVNRRGYAFSPTWTTLTQRTRDFLFAWGPSGGTPITGLNRIEIAVASNQGGKGQVWLRNLKFRELEAVAADPGTPVVTASSEAPERGASRLLEASSPGWRSAVDAKDAEVSVVYPRQREIGGVVVKWAKGLSAAAYDVEVSEDGATWSIARSMRDTSGATDFIMLPPTDLRGVRLKMRSPARASGGFGIDSLDLRGPEFSTSTNAFMAARAAGSPRGMYPRYFLNEQPYWTVMGVPSGAIDGPSRGGGDDRQSIMSEDGAIEPVARGFSIDPFLKVNGRLRTWDTGKVSHLLEHSAYPVPSVVRTYDDFFFAVTSWVSGEPGQSVLYARYRITNLTTSSLEGTLNLAIRPQQVLPPWQNLNYEGGFSPIESLKRDGLDVVVNGTRRICVLSTKGQWPKFSAVTSDQGEIVEFLGRDDLPAATEVIDAMRMASGVLTWPFAISARGEINLYIAIPLHDSGRADLPPQHELRTTVAGPFAEKNLRDLSLRWKDELGKVWLDVPQAGSEIAKTVFAQLAYMLVNRDGPALQPGSRTYKRSWIRDGAMMAEALLQVGNDASVKSFIDWYAPYQFESGKVPCVVDRRGPDPVPEHDSHGQLIYLIAEYHRYTGDTELVKRHIERVRKAADYILSLRAQRLTPDYTDPASTKTKQEPGKPAVPYAAFAGLVPESISHEGYSAKPMHSYWDDFWCLRGLEDAAYLEGLLGNEKAQKDRDLQASEFRKSLLASIELTRKVHNIDYIPGCVELGDFDATSTTIAVWPIGAYTDLPSDVLKRTFTKYVEHAKRRRDDTSFEWKDYTPYEWRSVGVLVRLGMKADALEVLDQLMGDRRPAGWRHFAEVVRKGVRTPGFIGDMPHTWCGTDYIHAALALFMYHDPSNDSLTLFAGIPSDWVKGSDTVGFRDLRTHFGAITANINATGDGNYTAKITGELRSAPAGGIWICSPSDTPPTSATVNGKDTPLVGGRVRIDALPAEVVLKK